MIPLTITLSDAESLHQRVQWARMTAEKELGEDSAVTRCLLNVEWEYMQIFQSLLTTTVTARKDVKQQSVK